jgi:hypothetical protein
MLDPNVIRGFEAKLRKRLEDLRFRVEHSRMTKAEAKEAGAEALREHQKMILAWCNLQFTSRGLPSILVSPPQQKDLEQEIEKWNKIVDDLPSAPGT